MKRVTVPLARLPRSAHGFRIAVVSDIHLGPVLGRGFAQRVVDTINSTQPDLIAVVGDLVDGSVKDLRPAAAPLSRLRARHGSYFVTGNHEYFSGADQWVEEVRRLGLHPLENARTELPAFDLAGVNDLAGESEGEGPDFGKALGDRDTSRAVVLLAHQPLQIHEAVRHHVDLQLSGHTHGGQLWPGNFVAAPPTRPSRAWTGTATRSCTSPGERAPGGRRRGSARRRTSRSCNWRRSRREAVPRPVKCRWIKPWTSSLSSQQIPLPSGQTPVIR